MVRKVTATTTRATLFLLAVRDFLYASSHRQKYVGHVKRTIKTLVKNRSEMRCRSVVRAFGHGAMGRRIDPSWGGPIELFLVPARLV